MIKNLIFIKNRRPVLSTKTAPRMAGRGTGKEVTAGRSARTVSRRTG